MGAVLRAPRIVSVMAPIDEPTSSFLRFAADDLQRQLGVAGIVQDLTLEEIAGGVALVSAIRIGQRSVEIRGIGANILAAYSDLCVAVPQPVLATAFAELVEP